MDPNPVVLDISSDEEGEIRGPGVGDDFDWISELLDEVDRETDDSDDVVLVSEVVLNSKQRLKSSVKVVDDDCVVLDGDPDKPISIDNVTVGESDDLLVVGEKGQVACRDYPHPRHLCAKFPFTSSLHHSHCDQCHCYVCDSLAPCVHWCTSISSKDHCHATDKEEFWNLQRKCLKNGDKACLPQMNQVQPSTLLEPNYVPQDHVTELSTNFGIPNIINQSRSERSGNLVPPKKFQPNLSSQQLRSTCNNIIPRDRRHNVGNLGPQFIFPHAVFKRTGSTGYALTTDLSGYSSSNNNHGSQYSRNPHLVATPRDKNSIWWQDFHGGMILEPNTYQISSQPNVSSIFANSVPSQPQVSSQPNVGSGFENSVSSQDKVSSQPNAGVFANSMPFQPQISSQPNEGSVFVNSVPSQLQVPSQPYEGGVFKNSVPSQPQIYSLPFPVSNDCQNIFHQGNQTSALDPNFTHFELSWVTPTGQSNQQPLAKNSQPQDVAQRDEPSAVPEFDHQFTGSTHPDSLDFQLDNWILDNKPVSGDLEVSMPSELHALSPERASMDGGIFFDF